MAPVDARSGCARRRPIDPRLGGDAAYMKRKAGCRRSPSPWTKYFKRMERGWRRGCPLNSCAQVFIGVRTSACLPCKNQIDRPLLFAGVHR